MSTSSSSSSPSSSAVTILIPGKSILKKPPPAQTSLFSRITRFLPQSQPGGSTFGIRSSTSGSTGNAGSGNNGNENGPDDAPLKRAHFILPQIATVYPISSINPPSTPNLKEEKRTIEEREAERRRRVVRGNSASISSSSDPDDEWWSMDKVDSFYKECCAGCDELPDPAISAAFINAANTNPRAVDFSGVQFTFASASILADVFTIEWGLRKLVFKECDLDEHTLKPILHALLIPNTLTFLSVASNRRLKNPAFRLIGAYLAKASSLQFLDVSQIPLDKKAVEYIVASLTQPPVPGLASLKLDDCSLKPAALDVLAKVVRTSSLRNISLRHNKINSTGAIALSVMIRDYPDSIPATGPTSPPSSPSVSQATSSLLLSPTFSQGGTGSRSVTPSSSLTPSPASSVTSLPLTSNLASQPLPASSSPQQPHAGPVLPPPTHPSLQPMQTTYTPYVPRSKRGNSTATTPTASPSLGSVPMITTSVRGGVTAVTANGVSAGINKLGSNVKGSDGRQPPGRNGGYTQGPSAALLDKVRALDSLPRLGALRTLDLKGNDLRSGASYLAQVLKRNRTLKVLNLSENRLDVACLVAIADALKYNTCLETLDLSRNPCCGSGSASGSGSLTRDRDRLYRDSASSRTERSPPDLEGVQSLRMSLTLTTSLKRLFLSSTNLSTQGAIALAEFLPESRSLLHLDLTGNQDLGVAGVMALNEGLKRNKTVRCLDLEVPPGAEEYTRRVVIRFRWLCREILNTCIRNTEEAERASQQQAPEHTGRGKAALWGMIEESELAKSVRLAGGEVGMIDTDVVLRARGCIRQLGEYIQNPSQPLQAAPLGQQSTQASGLLSPTSYTFNSEAKSTQDQPITPQESITKARVVVNELATMVAQTMSGDTQVDPEKLEELLHINDELTALVSAAEDLLRQPVPSGEVPSETKHGRRPSLKLQGLGIFNDGGIPDPADEDRRIQRLIDEQEEITTPRIDKGKQRAEPGPIEHEKVLSPTASLLMEESSGDESESESERFPPFATPEPGQEPEIDEDASPSSNDRSRSWVAEEGEVFRKGNVLLGPEEMEGEYAGEDLKRELLEAMVERPAPRTLNVDEFGVEIPVTTAPSEIAEQEPAEPVQPLPDTARPSPRPYIPRRSSSASIMSLVSPTVERATAMPLPTSPMIGAAIPAALKNVPGSASLPGTPTRELASPTFKPYVPLRTRTSNSSLNSLNSINSFSKQ